MFKNILVGLDGGPNGRDAIALAGALSDPDARLTLAHVRPGDLAEDSEDAQRLLEQERVRAEVKAELRAIVSASPGRGLHEAAEEGGIDLLVVGSCSHGAFGRAMLGDDTRASLNGAPCAVAIAAVGFGQHPTPITKIGVAYNESPESVAALLAAQDLALQTDARVHALEVVTIPSVNYAGLAGSMMGGSLDVMLQEATSRMQALPEVDGRAVCGLPGEELAAFGDEVDILVVGSRSYGPMRRLVSGSTSDYLERHARCSLLVLPRPALPA